MIAMSVGSWLGAVPPGLWALIGTIAGTIGLKLVEQWLNRNKDRNEVHRDMRSEIKELVDRVDKLEDEVTVWREKFYAEQEQVALLRTLIIQGGGTLPEVAASKSAQQPPTSPT